MIVELEDLKNSPENRLEFDFNEYIAELGNNVDVIGKILVELKPYGVKIRGHVSTEIELVCDRCLSIFNNSVEADIDEDFLFDSLIPEGVKEYELQSNEFVNELKDEDCVDITDIVYQSIILELPNQNLCKTDCPGSNEYQEMLKEETPDPRLEKFKNISENDN